MMTLVPARNVMDRVNTPSGAGRVSIPHVRLTLRHDRVIDRDALHGALHTEIGNPPANQPAWDDLASRHNLYEIVVDPETFLETSKCWVAAKIEAKGLAHIYIGLCAHVEDSRSISPSIHEVAAVAPDLCGRLARQYRRNAKPRRFTWTADLMLAAEPLEIRCGGSTFWSTVWAQLFDVRVLQGIVPLLVTVLTASLFALTKRGQLQGDGRSIEYLVASIAFLLTWFLSAIVAAANAWRKPSWRLGPEWGQEARQ